MVLVPRRIVHSAAMAARRIPSHTACAMLVVPTEPSTPRCDVSATAEITSGTTSLSRRVYNPNTSARPHRPASPTQHSLHTRENSHIPWTNPPPPSAAATSSSPPPAPSRPPPASPRDAAQPSPRPHTWQARPHAPDTAPLPSSRPTRGCLHPLPPVAGARRGPARGV